MKMENNKIKGEIVWKDKKWGLVLSIIVSIALILISSLSTPRITSAYFHDIIKYILITILLFFVIVNIFSRFSYVTKEGIFIGNHSSKIKQSFKKARFFSWNEIEYVKIAGKMTFIYRSKAPIPHLFLKPKGENKKYECRIYDPQGFVDTLKKLNKQHLLSKDSRYRK